MAGNDWFGCRFKELCELGIRNENFDGRSKIDRSETDTLIIWTIKEEMCAFQVWLGIYNDWIDGMSKIDPIADATAWTSLQGKLFTN